MDFVEICSVCARKAIIEAAKRIINSDKVCHSYNDLNFGVTFFGTPCILLSDADTEEDCIVTSAGIITIKKSSS